MQKDNRAKGIAVGVVLTGILILGGCGQKTTTGGPQGGPPEVAVVTIQPQRLVITTELTGRTSANLVAEVRPQVGGIIQKRLFAEGSDVKAGQVLYQIDPAPFQAALDNAAANLAAMQRNADRARAALQASIANVDPAAGHPANSPGQTASGSRRLSRTGPSRPASATRLSPRPKWPRTALQAAEAQVESDRKAMAAAEAAIQQAEAALKTARINLGYTRITAPDLRAASADPASRRAPW